MFRLLQKITKIPPTVACCLIFKSAILYYGHIFCTFVFLKYNIHGNQQCRSGSGRIKHYFSGPMLLFYLCKTASHTITERLNRGTVKRCLVRCRQEIFLLQYRKKPRGSKERPNKPNNTPIKLC